MSALIEQRKFQSLFDGTFLMVVTKTGPLVNSLLNEKFTQNSLSLSIFSLLTKYIKEIHLFIDAKLFTACNTQWNLGFFHDYNSFSIYKNVTYDQKLQNNTHATKLVYSKQLFL